MEVRDQCFDNAQMSHFAMDFVEELRDEFLMCNICFEEYREPKQLPCLHTFCRQCLSKYIVGKVVETGAEWFPCPFCRKAIQPMQGGELMTWADSFPTNFLLSQLSSKLETKTASHCENMDDVTSGRDALNRVKCSEHLQSYLVGYCTRQRVAVCEKCCVQKHSDCIRSHVRERDSRHMAEERKAECQESLATLQIKVEGIKDKVSAQEAALDSRTEQLRHQTEAALSDFKARFDLFFLDQKRELETKLENYVGEEKSRVSGLKSKLAELVKSSHRMSDKLDTVSDGNLSVKDLMLMDKVQDELKRQEQVVEKVRKDCFQTDIQFCPGSDVEKTLKGLSVGMLITERRFRSNGGARPRVQRYTSDPSSSVSQFMDHNAFLPAHRASPDNQTLSEVFENAPPPRSGRKKGRALSPPGAAASALSSSPSTAEGPTSGDHDAPREYRRRPEAPGMTRKTPTVPDFGAVLIEESRRSRSVPRRPRPASEGSFVTPPRRRGVPMETAIDGSSDSGRDTDRNIRVLERSPQIVSPRTGHSENQAGGSSRMGRSTSTPSATELQQISSEDDLSSLDSNVTYVTQAEGGGAPNAASAERDQASFDSDMNGQSNRKIVCVRHFLATHESDVKNQPGLVGISAVCRDRVAVSDRWNKVVKLLDIAGRIMDVLVISEDAEPWDLALRRPGLLAVTYPKEQKIRMVDVADGGSRLYYRSHFMTRDGYAALATVDSTSLLASVCPPFGSPKIHIIDYLGAVLRAVDCTNVAYPRCVDMCGGDEICVSDWTHHNVKVFRRDGPTPRYIYSGVQGTPDAQLKAPMGVAWDGRSHMFVVDGKTAKVHAISTQSGQCTAIFSLPQATGAELKLVTFVEASTDLCHNERALVVTTTAGAIQVYDLSSAY